MMKNYQRISNQRSGRIFFQKILSAVSKRGPRLTKVSSLLIADRRLLMAILLFFCSCGDEGLIDPYPEISLPKATGKLYATDLPTDTGSAWTYINVDTDQEFTRRVEGTRDVSLSLIHI